MWEITADEARKLSEVIFLVLPLLALADLVESGTELGRPSRRALRSSDATEDEDVNRENEVRAVGKAVLFYGGFVVSASLSLVGLLTALPAYLLAAQISVFFLMAWCLFSQIGDKFVIDLARIYKESGGPALIAPGRRMRPHDTRRLIAVLRDRALRRPSFGAGTIDAATGKVWRHRRRVALIGIIGIPTLTLTFAAFVIVLDIWLCTSARVVGS